MGKLNRRKKKLYACNNCGLEVKPGNRYIHGHHKGRLGTGKPKSPPQLCACGFCGLMTKPGSKYITGHGRRKYPKPISNHHLCECGFCEELVSSDKRFVCGHSRRGKKCTKEQRKRLSDAHIGIPLSEEHRKNIGLGGIGTKGQSKGCTPWNLGKTTPEEVVEKNRKQALLRMQDPNVRRNLSDSIKELWKSLEYVTKQMSSRKLHPNKPESFLLSLLEEIYPGEWKFAGDFSFWINGKNPDFVNCNGQKKIIELYGDYWHKGQDPKDREKIFAEYGWDTLIIWENELDSLDKVKSRINEFVRG